METISSSDAPRKKRKLVKKFDNTNDELLHNFFSNARNLNMMAGSFYQPKKNNLKPLGEDAHFICEEEQTIGVADGVGGWAKKGIDSGIYARELMDNAVFLIQEKQPENGAVNPKKVLNEAFLNTEAKGASTACIIKLKDNFLHAVNLGDSGFLVIRDGKIVYNSPFQQSGFNCPFQLGNWTGYVLDLAEETVVEVEPGDVVVAATDGLFDNVYFEEIEDVVNRCLREENPPELMARNLVRLARKQSLLKNTISPFTKAAMDFGLSFEDYKGGKYDDVTVIAAYIY
ncbi:hypothetical protein ACH5RR_015129 [Cinchona calisaya]|uniref:Protein phosphatase n=1 Tax=Cinchona calisaya TaxID=153742 RepID=A0ABD2ZVD2_9GENT